MNQWKASIVPLTLVAALLSAGPASGQSARVPRVAVSVRASNLIMPQTRRPPAERAAVVVEGVEADVSILEQAATVHLTISLHNPTGTVQEAQMLVPVPDGVALRGFGFAGPGQEPTAELLPRDEAVGVYQSIVSRMKDPALLEFAGLGLVRSSVFPVPAGGRQTVRLTYEQLLPADGDRVDFALPRSEAVDYDVPWTVKVTVRSKRPVSTVYSPSHGIDVERLSGRSVAVRAPRETMREPGAFLLSYLLQAGEGLTASLLAYPDPEQEGGFFLMLAGLPAVNGARDEKGRPVVQREVTLVLDRSGSMSGQKLAQAKAAALQVIAGLYDGERFNIIDYSDSIAGFARSPVAKDDDRLAEARDYLDRIRPGGGTNIKDALIEALRPEPTEGCLPIVLFLTDGLPTVGERNEVRLRQAVEAANAAGRRIFTFGVGTDVNAPLLSHLARQSRATSTFVLPGEDVEVKVAQVYKRLFGPVLSEPELTCIGPDGEPTTRRVADLLPRTLPDLFEGDQLVLLGKYRGDEPLALTLRGRFQGKPRTFAFRFKLDKATTQNAFVPRLWASRKIAMLIEEIRQAGAAASAEPSVVAPAPATDARLKELVDEITRLSLKYGVLTEYTAFLAREGEAIGDISAVNGRVRNNLERRAIGERSGTAAVNQSLNNNKQMQQASSNRLNGFVNKDLQRVQITTVQQVNDLALFNRDGVWIDGRVINGESADRIDARVKVGTPEFAELLSKLIQRNRNGVLTLRENVLMEIDGRNVLIERE